MLAILRSHLKRLQQDCSKLRRLSLRRSRQRNGMTGGSLVTDITERRSLRPRPCQKPYSYKPLEHPDSIRTLRLHATKNRIECSLQQISLSDGGYQALSYVWGSSETPFKAIVIDDDGKELGYVPLTTNVQAALCDLRDAKELKSKVFWIDQICINQGGDEKNHQVALMGEIYRNASSVITYVGPTAEDEEEEICGMALLHRLDGHFEANYELLLAEGDLWEAHQKQSEFPVLELPEDLQESHGEVEGEDKYVSQGWRWLLQVAFGEWTQRLWIVQEQLLNKNIAMLHGPSLLSWDAVAIMSSLIFLDLLPGAYVNRFWRENHTHSSQNQDDVAQSVYTLWIQRQMQKEQYPQSRKKLVDLMAWHDNLQCWDPRDRIFAMLAISSDASALGIVPDYSESSAVDRVFLDASVRILQNGEHLSNALDLACRWAESEVWSEDPPASSDPVPTSALPSWSLGPPHYPIPAWSGVCTPHPRMSLRAPPCFRLDHSILVLKGRRLDRISMSMPVSFSSPSTDLGVVDESYIQIWSQRLRSWTAVLIHLGINLQNAAALGRALTTSIGWFPIDWEGCSITEATAFAFWCLLRRMTNVVRVRVPEVDVDVDVTATIEICDSAIRELSTLLLENIDVESFNPDSPLNPDESRAYEGIWNYARLDGRSFCVTENGKTCSAVNQPRKGDVVAALEGTEHLWILRPVGIRYRLIGDAYVDGLMKGEAYEGLDPDEVDYEIELV